MKRLTNPLTIFLVVFLAISTTYCEPDANEVKVTPPFTAEDFQSSIDTAKRYYIDRNIDMDRGYKDAAFFALRSLPHSLELFPEDYFKDREKYEEKDDIYPGKTFKLSPKDKFLIFDPDYEYIKKERDKKVKDDGKKLTDEEVKQLIEREQKKKEVLSANWERISFSKKDFDRIIEFIEKNKEKYSKIPIPELYPEEEKNHPFTMSDVYLAAANGFLSSLDPHSAVYLKSAWDESMHRINNGSFEGIGAILSGGGNREVVVENPLEGRPAVKAGIRSGDIIIAVDGKSIKGLNLDKVVELIKGEKGTEVVLSIKRRGVSGQLEIPVVRDTILIKNITAHLVKDHDDIGYIKLAGFVKAEPGEPPMLTQIAKKYQELEAEAKRKGTKLDALILDLRNNAGGYLDLAIEIADMFISKGVIVSTKSPNQSPEDVYATPKDLTHIPMAVLINSKSASASEIVASAIKYHGRGLVLGERTFGKATVQKLMDLETNSDYIIKITQARYYSPSGKTIQVVGVHPDIAISSEEDNSFPFRYREENMFNHLPEIPHNGPEKSHYDINLLDSWVKNHGVSKSYLDKHKNDPIKPDYQLIRSLDYVEAMIKTNAHK